MAASSSLCPWGRRRAMALLLPLYFAFAAPAQSQNANVAVSLQVSKTTDLQIGNELLVSTTVRNNGPGPAANVFVLAGQDTLEVFLYDLVRSETPECGVIDQIEVDPPTYSFSWVVPSLAVGSAITCTARLRVIRVPATWASVMYAGAQPAPQTSDPDQTDNRAQVALGFALTRPHTIPSNSWWAFAMAICGVLLGGLVLRRR